MVANKKFPAFSVLMSVYFKEKPEFLKESIESLINQTLVPDEIVIVKDGVLGNDLDKILEFYTQHYPQLFRVLSLDTNQGLGAALNFGLRSITNEYIARMDSDDVCHPSRFKKQISFMVDNPIIDVVGSALGEFKISSDEKISRFRRVPETNQQIAEYIKYRCPINHQTVVYKRTKVLEAGGYNANKVNYEDFPLWYRMVRQGFVFYNIQEPLVYARTGNDLIGRRHGKKYLLSEINLFKEMYRDGYINVGEGILSIMPRVILRLLPKKILQVVYSMVLRSGK